MCPETIIFEKVGKLKKVFMVEWVGCGLNVWMELGKGTRGCGCQCPTDYINMHITYTINLHFYMRYIYGKIR